MMMLDRVACTLEECTWNEHHGIPCAEGQIVVGPPWRLTQHRPISFFLLVCVDSFFLHTLIHHKSVIAHAQSPSFERGIAGAFCPVRYQMRFEAQYL